MTNHLPLILILLLLFSAMLVFVLAWLFYSDPQKAFKFSTHRPEKLPDVMVDRYIGIGIIQVGLIFFGSLEMVAVFCVAGAVMGLGDGLIYARAGYPHFKHTSAGLLAVAALLLTLYFIATGTT